MFGLDKTLRDTAQIATKRKRDRKGKSKMCRVCKRREEIGCLRTSAAFGTFLKSGCKCLSPYSGSEPLLVGNGSIVNVTRRRAIESSKISQTHNPRNQWLYTNSTRGRGGADRKKPADKRGKLIEEKNKKNRKNSSLNATQDLLVDCSFRTCERL